jgi:hypothetical protein
MVILFVLMAFVGLATAASCWGAISSDGWDSSEWERRQSWCGFH